MATGQRSNAAGERPPGESLFQKLIAEARERRSRDLENTDDALEAAAEYHSQPGGAESGWRRDVDALNSEWRRHLSGDEEAWS
jgi:hypothetical protein